MAELKQALEDAAEATTMCDKAAEDMLQLYTNLLSVNARYAWTRFFRNKPMPTPTQTSKG